MRLVDLAYLVSAGSTVRAIVHLRPDMTSVQQYSLLNSAKHGIHTLIFQSVYSEHFHAPLGNQATKLIEELNSGIETTWPSDGGHSGQLSQWDIEKLQQAFFRFEAVLESELQSIAAYTITPKGGFDTGSMIDDGTRFFQEELGDKVPEAVGDIKEAMRCIAFEVATAAGFHLHRANETVLRRYWDAVTEGEPRPKSGNMGVYLTELRKLKAGDTRVRNQLANLKDFHRNPLMHPEQSLETIDEAIDLMSAIRCSIGYMLKEIG